MGDLERYVAARDRADSTELRATKAAKVLLAKFIEQAPAGVLMQGQRWSAGEYLLTERSGVRTLSKIEPSGRVLVLATFCPTVQPQFSINNLGAKELLAEVENLVAPWFAEQSEQRRRQQTAQRLEALEAKVTREVKPGEFIRLAIPNSTWAVTLFVASHLGSRPQVIVVVPQEVQRQYRENLGVAVPLSYLTPGKDLSRVICEAAFQHGTKPFTKLGTGSKPQQQLGD